MCDIRNHYHEYAKAEEALRRFKVGKDLPGFEYLRVGAVIIKLEGFSTERKLLEEIEKHCFIVKVKYVKKHIPVKQHMLEAIRSVSKYGQKLTIEDFLKQIVEEM